MFNSKLKSEIITLKSRIRLLELLVKCECRVSDKECCDCLSRAECVKKHTCCCTKEGRVS